MLIINILFGWYDEKWENEKKNE